MPIFDHKRGAVTLSLTRQAACLHPSIREEVDETAVIQGHNIRFATVDLAMSPSDIRARLLGLCAPVWKPLS